MTISTNQGAVSAISTHQGAVSRVLVNHGDGAGEQAIWTESADTETPGLVVEYTVDDFRLDDDDPVTTWPDQVGSMDATAPTGAEPEYTSSGFNGGPAITFDGTQYLTAGTFPTTLTQPYTVVAAAAWEQGASSSYAYYGAGGDARSLLQVSNTTDFMFWAGRTGGVTQPGSHDPHVLVAVADGSNSVLRIDRSEVAGNAGPLGQDGVTIGARDDGARGLVGHLGYLAIYDRRLTRTERRDVSNALAEQWDLPLDYDPFNTN